MLKSKKDKVIQYPSILKKFLLSFEQLGEVIGSKAFGIFNKQGLPDNLRFMAEQTEFGSMVSIVIPNGIILSGISVLKSGDECDIFQGYTIASGRAFASYKHYILNSCRKHDGNCCFKLGMLGNSFLVI